MANVFANIQEFKQFAGGAVNSTVSLDSLAPFIVDAGNEHIAPHLGGALWAAFLDTTANSNLPLNDPLREKIKKPLAMMTLYEYSKVGVVMLTEGGLIRAVSENTATAYQYQEKEFRAYHLEKGYDNIETMLLFLMSNRGAYPLWALGSGFARHTELFVRYALQLKLHYGLDASRYTFELLRPLLRDCEKFVIETVFPLAFVTHLKSKNEMPTATVPEMELMTMLQALCVNYAVEEATRRQMVRIVGKNIVSVTDNAQSNQSEKAAEAWQMRVKTSHHRKASELHLQRAKDYVLNNRAAFPLAFHTSAGGTNNASDAWRDTNDTLKETTKFVIF